MQYYKGKTFIAPSKLLRAERALYFPNLHGRTLASKKGMDTTPVLQKKISIVSVYSSTWAERQVASFASRKENPALFDAVQAREDVAQFVDINVEDVWLKVWLVRLFAPFLRRKLPVSSHHRYFMIRGGISIPIRDALGLLNSKVGYVYLVDGDCKIRWAGSGVAQPDEKKSLVNGVRRLLGDGVREEDIKAKRLPLEVKYSAIAATI